jgi:hypothetical protein
LGLTGLSEPSSYSRSACEHSDSSPAAREVELWCVRKDSRELRCLAVYMPTGIDLRLIEGEDFRRTQPLKDGPSVEARAEEWRTKLLEKGWA